MSARNLYGDFYQYDSTARKREYVEIPVQKEIKKRNVQKRIETKQVRKNNFGVMAFIFTGFIMTMIITYRFNLINEKNLQVQKLQKQLTRVESQLLSKQIEVEQNTDLNSVEAYAKQQLGMQKPEKNQTVYVDTTSTTQKVEIEDQSSFINKVLNKAKSIISNIF